jgi:hypothetical protein
MWLSARYRRRLGFRDAGRLGVIEITLQKRTP